MGRKGRALALIRARHLWILSNLRLRSGIPERTFAKGLLNLTFSGPSGSSEHFCCLVLGPPTVLLQQAGIYGASNVFS